MFCFRWYPMRFWFHEEDVGRCNERNRALTQSVREDGVSGVPNSVARLVSADVRANTAASKRILGALLTTAADRSAALHSLHRVSRFTKKTAVAAITEVENLRVSYEKDCVSEIQNSVERFPFVVLKQVVTFPNTVVPWPEVPRCDIDAMPVSSNKKPWMFVFPSFSGLSGFLCGRYLTGENDDEIALCLGPDHLPLRWMRITETKVCWMKTRNRQKNVKMRRTTIASKKKTREGSGTKRVLTKKKHGMKLRAEVRSDSTERIQAYQKT